MAVSASPGAACIVCGHTPAFHLTGEALCWQHLPWNEGKTLEQIESRRGSVALPANREGDGMDGGDSPPTQAT